jgi:hypothetical protein
MAIHESGVEFGESLVAEAHAVEGTGAEALDEHVGIGQQVTQNRCRLGVLEVDHHAANIAVT